MRKWLMRAGSRLRRGALDLLYPPRCLGCDARAAAKSPLCAACLAGLERAREASVRQRLDALPEADGAFETAFALWRFDPDGALRSLQHALKYQNRPRYGVAAGRWMGAALREHLLAKKLSAVVPVPLHRTRHLERGYNQTAMLAQGVAERLGIPYRPEWLVRPRPTRSQTRLSRRARWQNVAGAFAVPQPEGRSALGGAPQPLAGRTALLIDDVLTTGATVTAAARVLRRAGAEAVHLATLALAE